MTGHTPWSQIRHKKPPWWNLLARFKRRKRLKRIRKLMLKHNVPQGTDWRPGEND